MSVETETPLLTTKQIAERLGVHPKQVYRLLRQGLPAHRVGGEWRFREREVLTWSAKRTGVAIEDAVNRGATDGGRRQTTALLAANGESTVRALLGVLNSGGAELLWGFVQSDREQALEWLTSEHIDAAGTHGAAPPTRIGAQRTRVARVHLAEREVGLVARRIETASLASLSKHRFATRPDSAGVVLHLNAALNEAGLDRVDANKHATAYDSHQEVIEAILRREADVGLTTHAMAAQAGLAFRALATESYGLLVRSDAMGSAAIVRLCEAAQSSAFRARLSRLAGCDAKGAGDIRYDEESNKALSK